MGDIIFMAFMVPFAIVAGIGLAVVIVLAIADIFGIDFNND